jgi:hypothetical protein
MLINEYLCGPGDEKSTGDPVGNHINFPLRKGYLCEQKQSSLTALSQGQHRRDLKRFQCITTVRKFVDSHIIKATSVDFL